MSAVSLGDLIGSAPDPDGHMAAEFLEAWFGADAPTELIQVVRLQPVLEQPKPITAPKSGILSVLRNTSLLDFQTEHDVHWNVYHSVGTLTSVPNKRPNDRGGKELVGRVPGIFMDLDVDSGSKFENEDQIVRFTAALPIEPTLITHTGTGGRHLYWRTDRSLSGPEADVLGKRWWSLAQEIADTRAVKIDHVFGCERMMKTPGSWRWPKPGEPASLLTRSETVSLDGPVVSVEHLTRVSQGPWERYLAQLERVRADQRAREDSMKASLETELGLDGWMRMWVTSSLPDYYDAHTTWDEILLPLGWTRLRDDMDGRTHWARPNGKGNKSANTKADSPVLALHSESPDTGLLELHEAGIRLTKYRVTIQLHWHGDEAAFVRAYLTRLSNKGL